MKGIRWMPWLMNAMKDVANLRNSSGRRFAAFDPEVSEWGNPIRNDDLLFMRMKLTWGSETSQYPEEQKTTASCFLSARCFERMESNSCDSLSSGERNGTSPNQILRYSG
jgi:hypothetical protein